MKYETEGRQRRKRRRREREKERGRKSWRGKKKERDSWKIEERKDRRSMRFHIGSKRWRVLFRPLEIAHIYYTYLYSQPVLEWPTEAWNSQFLFPAKISQIVISGLPFSCHLHRYPRVCMCFVCMQIIQYICLYPCEALVSFRRQHESRISNWTDSGKRSNERVRRGEGLIPEEIPGVISAIRLTLEMVLVHVPWETPVSPYRSEFL